MPHSDLAPTPTESIEAAKEAALGVVLCEASASEDQFDYVAAMVSADGRLTWAAWNQGQQMVGGLGVASQLTRDAVSALAAHARQAGFDEPIFMARYDRGTLGRAEKGDLIAAAARAARDRQGRPRRRHRRILPALIPPRRRRRRPRTGAYP